jgi:hypothetical protein
MDCCEFEPKIQVQCVLDLVSIVRNGGLVEQKATVLQHIGCIVGSLGSYIDTQDVPFASGTFDLPNNVDSLCDEIESQLTATGYAISPETWALIIKLAMFLLEKYL